MEEIIFVYLVIILSAVFHEYAHAFMAYSLGDNTAKNMGRLTLNPIAHMDIFGTVLLPLFLLFTGGMFLGYAKPVPYNPYNLRDQKYGEAKIALAGPASNFLIALIFGLSARFLPLSLEFFSLLTFVTLINFILCFFNLIPIPPLDGSKLLRAFFPNNPLPEMGIFNIFIALMIALILVFPFSRILTAFLVGL